MDALLSALLESGLIDADTADIIRRQNDPEAARIWAERQIAIAAQGALSAQQQRLIYMLRDTDYRPTERDVSWFWDNENELLWDAMRPRILEVLTERSTFAAVVGGQAGTFSLVNQQVIRWAETYYVDPSDTTYGSIPNLNLTSRQQFADVFAAWNRGELAGRPQGLPSLIQALVPTFGADRAERIAVTETTRLFTESIRQAGLANPFTTAFRVLTANDELVCPICAPVASQVVAKTDASGASHPVRGSIGYPPFHVRCRCGITEETEQSLRIGAATPATTAPAPETTTATAPPAESATPLGPNGRPVSEALQLPVRGKLREPIADTIAMIDSVHGDGTLPDLPILQGSKNMPQQGYYKFLTGSGQPIEIKISLAAENIMNTAAHEIGHFLEAQGVLPGVQNNPAAQAQLNAVYTAFNNSQAVQRLNALLNRTELLQTQVGGVTISAVSDLKYTAYLLENREIWARAYAQYIAVKSQNPAMLEELKREQAYYYPAAWADDDFAPVVSAIDQLFTTLGWIR